MMPLKRGLILLIFFAVLPSLYANPFLGGNDDDRPAPVRSQGAGRFLTNAQFVLRERMADAFSEIREGGGSGALAAVLIGAFVYGLLHAAGPGHRKAVVFSLFLTRKARAWEPLAAGFLSSAVHAGTGLVIVGIFTLVSGAAARAAAVDNASLYMEGFSFLALAAAALILGIRKIILLIRERRRTVCSTAAGKGNGQAAGQVSADKRKGGIYGVAALSSLVPCPGAVMVLLFALYLRLTSVGILGVLSMSAGMGLVISAAGYLAFFGREGLFRRLESRGREIGRIADLLELGSYLFMFAFAVYIALPFLLSLI